jgi:tetratricopeptide (TPR) repeat protein
LRFATVFTALCLSMLPAEASAKWTRLTSTNFVFVGDADEARIRRVAERLEQFRAAMMRVLPNAVADSPVPTTVFVFRDAPSFAPYRGGPRGQTVDATGYFLAYPDTNVIALNLASFEQALSTVFHEYTHALVSNTVGPVPLWIGEGLAELYESFEEHSGGKAALIGVPLSDHVALLRLPTVSLMPLVDLLAVTEDSPVYNERIRRGVFYAQSWALTHYLTFGSAERAGQLSTYLERVQGGTPSKAAFRQSMGDLQALERELREYTRLLNFNVLRFEFGETPARAVVARGVVLDQPEADGYLADLLARIGREAQARTVLRRALEQKSGTARAALALGLLEMRRGQINLALPLLERAATAAPSDGFAQSSYGRALLARHRALSDTDPAARSTLALARSVLQRAATLMPGTADILVQAARAELLSDDDAANARELLERAVRLAPSREAYRLMLAQALIRQGDVERAADVLAPLVAPGSRADVRDMARQLLASAVQRARELDASSGVGRAVDPTADAPGSGGRSAPR